MGTMAKQVARDLEDVAVLMNAGSATVALAELSDATLAFSPMKSKALRKSSERVPLR